MERATRHFTGTGLALPLFVAACALISVLLLLLSGLGTRLNLWHFRTGFTMLKVAGYSGLACAVLSLVSGALAVRKRHAMGIVISLVALILALIAFAVPFWWKMKANDYPRIHDISTDLQNPPPFVALAPKRPDRLQYGGAAIASQQLQAYPDIKTLLVPLPKVQAFDIALSAARDLGWEIVATVPPEGRIEATDTTKWFGFKDDIVIRVVAAGNRSLVDIRSASRQGISDVGTNARRVRNFMEKVSSAYTLRVPSKGSPPGVSPHTP